LGDILHELLLSVVFVVLFSLRDTSDEFIALLEDNKCIPVDEDEEDEGCADDEPTCEGYS